MNATKLIDTGKVLIGLRYQRPVHYDVDKDMHRLQSALLGNSQRRLSDGFIALVCLGLAVLIVCLLRFLR